MEDRKPEVLNAAQNINIRKLPSRGQGELCSSVPQGVDELRKLSIATSKYPPHIWEQWAPSQYVSPFGKNLLNLSKLDYLWTGDKLLLSSFLKRWKWLMLALCWIQKHLMLIKSEMCGRQSQVLPESVNPLAKQFLNLLGWEGLKEALVPSARARGGSWVERCHELTSQQGGRALWGTK